MDDYTLPGGVTWRITGQTETQQAGASGTYTPGVQVAFTLSTGEAGTVFLPRTQYTAANVKAAVHAWAQNLAEIAQLSNE